jgi:multiple sugar transport system substrate-binding protein
VRLGVSGWRPSRRFAAIVAAALLGTACVTAGETGGGSSEAGGQVEPRVAKEPSEPTTITFASWVGESPQFKKFAEDFQKEYPNITVEFQNVPAERATDKLLTQVAGGNPPDVAFMDQAAVEDFATRNALVNLDNYIAGSDVIQPDDYVEGFRSAAVYEGSMFALPFDGETTGLFYRTDLFEQAGIDGPPETWAELEDTAARLTNEASKTYGWILFAPESQYYWYPFLWQAGGDLLSPDGQEIIFDSPEAKQAAEFYVGLRKYSPPDYFNSNSWDGRVAFATGKVAMYMAGAWFGGEMKASFPKITGKWDVAALPEGPEGCATTLAGDALVIFNASQNHDAAWLWIEYLSRPENMKMWTFGSKTSTLLPPRQSLLDDPELGKFNPWLEGFADNMKCAVTSNVTQEKWSEVEWGPLNQNLGKAIYGEVSPEAALEKAAREGEKILSGE